MGTASSTVMGMAHGVQLLHFSDWHGQLDPVRLGMDDVGGAAVLSAYFQADRAANPNTVITTAGDEYGASPPIASLNNEEPAVKALNLMGVRLSTFGNHNFDRGVMHTQAMLNLATYKSVSANLSNLAANLPAAVPQFEVVDVAGVKVAFIGITNEDAASLTTPGSMGTMVVQNAVSSALAAKTAAAGAGATIFVALVHMGITQRDPVTMAISGPLVDFANGVGTQFDLVLGDHTNFSVNEKVGGVQVVECKSQGLQYARIQLEVDAQKRPSSITVTLVTPTKTPSITPDGAISTMLAPYAAALAMQLDPKIAQVSDVFPRGSNIERLGETALGDLVADALWNSDFSYGEMYSVEMGLTNGGGIRAPIPSSYVVTQGTVLRPGMGTTGPYDVVRGDIYTTLPFGNGVVWVDITGDVVWAMLENAVSALPAANGKFAQVAGIQFTFDVSRPVGQRILAVRRSTGADVPNDNSTTYRLATSDFLFQGGDGYSMLVGKPGIPKPYTMADALERHMKRYFEATTEPLVPTIVGRISPTAQVVINEVNPNLGGGTAVHDLLELRVTAAGNLLGLEVASQGASSEELLVRLPSLAVAVDDIVVVHLVQAASVLSSELGQLRDDTTKDSCTSVECYPAAWDIYGSGTTLPFSHRVLVVRDARKVVVGGVPGDVVRDALVVAKVMGAPNPLPSNFEGAVQALQVAMQWTPANCGGAPCTYSSMPTVQGVAVDWSSVSATNAGNSVVRKPGMDSNAASDFVLAPSSWGLPNP